MIRRSIRWRLLSAAAVWVTLALVLTAVVLNALVESTVLRGLRNELDARAEQVVAQTEITDEGILHVRRDLSDPHFARPLSGWYWQISSGDEVLARSRSLWDQKLPLPIAETPFGKMDSVRGPRAKTLYMVTERFTLPDWPDPLVVQLTAPSDELETTMARFTGLTTATLTLLGLGLLGAVALQVSFGLRPLGHVSRALAEIRSGRRQRLEGEFPTEVKPLVDEINALLEHDARVVERARTQAGNLAHALKTPLAVLRNDADGIPGTVGERLRDQAATLGRVVDVHLARARAAGTHGVLARSSPVLPVAEGLRRALLRIFGERDLSIELEGLGDLSFQGEQHDLEEMLGNLIENACKWARSRVRVGGTSATGRLVLTVEDDGTGIPAEALAVVTDRGRRLDETVPGSGLGLAIVSDMADLYGGHLHLSASRMGGLRARLDLPLAQADSG